MRMRIGQIELLDFHRIYCVVRGKKHDQSEYSPPRIYLCVHRNERKRHRRVLFPFFPLLLRSSDQKLNIEQFRSSNIRKEKSPIAPISPQNNIITHLTA